MPGKHISNVGHTFLSDYFFKNNQVGLPVLFLMNCFIPFLSEALTKQHCNRTNITYEIHFFPF